MERERTRPIHVEGRMMKGSGSGVGCGVVEWVKGSTLRWFGHIERMGNGREGKIS